MSTAGDLTGATLGHYRIGALIGRGGMGDVYQAHDTVLGRQIALKVLPPAAVADESRLARFIVEARAASGLNHPHVVSIHEIGQAAGDGGPPAGAVHYIAMELVIGKTLRALLDARPLELKRALELLGQAADALAAAHGAGIVHRDLKPENLMVADAGYLKVLDFGLAKLRAVEPEGETTTTLGNETAPGLVMGTVGYMSPEQAQGRPVDHRTDIFAFGCVLYETVAGRRAFAGSSAVDTLHHIIHRDPDPLGERASAAPPDLQRICRKCLAKDPEDRYQSMKEVAIDLREVRRQLESQPPAAAVPVPRRPGWSRGALIGVLAVVAAAAAAAWWLSRGGGEPDRPAIKIERITSSGGVTDAVISPDGKYIVYVESAQGLQSLWLRQVAATRPLQLVPPAQVGYWGSGWSRDGSTIYYVVKGQEHPAGTLFQIPILGGTPRALLSGLDSAVTIAPDGRRMAFLRANHPEGGASAVMVADVDGTNVRAIAIKRPPEFFAPGFFARPSWSPDGTRLSAAVRNSQTRDARLVTVDGSSGTEQAFPTRLAEATFTSWMPDNSGIAFVGKAFESFGFSLGGQIWMQPYPSGPLRPITHDLIEYRSATLDADGSAMVSVGFDVSTAIWVIPADGREPRKLPSERYDGARGVVGGGDRRILFTSVQSNRHQIWSMDLDGGNRRELTTTGSNLSPELSPDGRTIVFFSTRDDKIGIWRMNADGTAPRLVAAVPDASHITFRPDGRHVIFTSQLDGPASTWEVSIDGGTPAPVAPLFERAAISPDGRFLAGLYRAAADAPLELAILPATGGAPLHRFDRLNLTPLSGGLEWNADGTGILYTSAERGNLWLQRIAGGPASRVTNFAEGTIVRFDRFPDTNEIVASRGVQTRDAFLITNFR